MELDDSPLFSEPDRSLIEASNYNRDPQYFKAVWDKAVASNLQWAGFHRLKLSDEDRAYFTSELNLERPEGI